jgi:hypothetical protein
MKTRLILSFLFIILSITACNTTEPPPPCEKPTLALKLEDVSCTEAWIELTTTNLQLPATITIKQINPTGDTLSQVSILNTQDSLLYIDTLLPNQTYQYQASSIEHQVSSNELSVTTMDTTSHNFTFETWTFGEHSSSVLYDVAILDENNIWAVGEIYINDSLGQPDPNAFNAIHWDGIDWELKRIYYYGACSAVEYPPLRAIWAFSENNIVITCGGSIGWFDGNTVNLDCGVNPLLTGAINKLWGSSSDLYVVGNNGNIAWYNGTEWTKIESGTELNINDIWGDYNGKTNEWEILAVASNIFSGFEKEVIKINHLKSQILSRDGIDETLSSVWFKANIKYYVVGSGTYKKNKLSDTIWEGDPLDITNYFENRIRANDINDVFVAGAFGELLHFNGVRWKSYLNETGLFSGAYLSADIKNNIQVAVGYEAAQAKIIVGNRE